MPHYPLGMSAAEMDRLRRQHATWRGATRRAWRRAGFARGDTIVDLGCGPGFTSRDLLRVVGRNGRVVAVDASSDATNVLRDTAARERLSNLEVVTADAADLDLTAIAPSGVFARWLFCYLAEPARAIERLAAGLRPGGTAAIIDYWNYRAIRAEPASPLFTAVFAAVYDSFRDAGGSLDVAGTIPAALAARGLTITHVDAIAEIGRPGSPVWRWIAAFQAIYLPSLVAGGYLARGVVDEYLTWWHALETTPGAFVASPPMLCVVARKP